MPLRNRVRPIKRPWATKRPKLDPLTLLMKIGGWGFTLAAALAPLIQMPDKRTPGKMIAAVLDCLFGAGEGAESDLWQYMTSIRPVGISVAQHEAGLDFIECMGRSFADIIEDAQDAVIEAQVGAIDVGTCVQLIRSSVDDALDRHGLEACVQAVVDAT